MSSSPDHQPLVSHKIRRDELKAGDHIYSWRRPYIYSHHGIYVGDGKVIHFTGRVSAGIGRIVKSSSESRPCTKCGDKVGASGVISSCLDCFLKGGKLYRYQYGVTKEGLALAIKVRGLCTTAPCDPPELVISRASYLLENNSFGKYSLIQNNCEDFSLYCKTEKIVAPESSQSRGCSSQIKSIGAFVSAFYKMNVGGAYCKSRYKNDIGVRKDVTRISVEDLSAYYLEL